MIGSPDETIKYLLGQYFEILTYKWSTRGHMMSHVMNFISRPFLRHPSPMVTFFAPIKMRLFNFWVVSLKISINKIASILRVSEFWKFFFNKKISGKRMSLHNRTITHKDLHPKTANQKELFHSASSLDWQPMTDHSRGMQSVIRITFLKGLTPSKA